MVNGQVWFEVMDPATETIKTFILNRSTLDVIRATSAPAIQPFAYLEIYRAALGEIAYRMFHTRPEAVIEVNPADL